MSGAFRSLVIAGVVGLSVLVGESPATRAGDPTWGRLPSSSRSSKPSEFKTAYYYNNAASTSVARAWLRRPPVRPTRTLLPIAPTRLTLVPARVPITTLPGLVAAIAMSPDRLPLWRGVRRQMRPHPLRRRPSPIPAPIAPFRPPPVPARMTRTLLALTLTPPPTAVTVGVAVVKHFGG